MKCPSCDYQNRVGVRFCEECGEPLPEPDSKSVPETSVQVESASGSSRKAAVELTCPVCGFSNRGGIKFCEECGATLVTSALKVAPPEPKPAAPKPQPAPIPKPVTVKCPACGFDNPKNLRFCGACGASLTPPTPKPAAPKPQPAPLPKPVTVKCPACGFDNPKGLRFCGACGASLVPAKPQPIAVPGPATVQCPACGFDNPRGLRFCGACGESLIARPAPTRPVRRAAPKRKGVPVWLKAILRLAASSISGYVMGKLGMLALNALLQSLG
jgi:DNA-directed RNA polymerase subunit M/transcription elongation factor TFIIS